MHYPWWYKCSRRRRRIPRERSSPQSAWHLHVQQLDFGQRPRPCPPDRAPHGRGALVVTIRWFPASFPLSHRAWKRQGLKWKRNRRCKNVPVRRGADGKYLQGTM